MASVGGSDDKQSPPADSPSTAPAYEALPTGDLDVNAIRDGVAHNARSFSPTMYRVVGNDSSPDARVQMQRHASDMAAKFTAQKADWNVATNSPVRTTPTTYGVSWVSSSNKDMLAFAVDTANIPTTGSNKRNQGIVSGVSNTCGSSCQTSSLYVLTDLYNSSGPQVLNYNTAANGQSFALNGLFFNFSTTTPRLWSLDQSGKLRCLDITAWSGSGTITPSNASSYCSHFSSAGQTGGITGSVTWSGPFPEFDSNGLVTRTYFCNDGGKCSCVVTSTGNTCTGWPKTLDTGSIMGPPTVYQASSTEYVMFVGDEKGNFFRVDDNNGTITSKSVSLCGGGTCGTSYQVHSAPAIDYNNGIVYVATGAAVFGFGETLPDSGTFTWSSTDTLNLSSPVDAWPSIDPTNGYLYVTVNNTLYKLVTNSSGLTGVSYSTALFNKVTAATTYDNTLSIAAGSQPLGYPLVYYSSVFVNTGTGGTSTSAASGAIEQYFGCNATASKPVLSQMTNATQYGVLVPTGEVLDFESGNLNFGYETGVVGTSDDGKGGVVQYNANASPPTTNWSCPSPYTGSSTAACGSYGCTLAAGSCLSNSDCSSPTPVCNTSTGLCVGCTADTDCGAGQICANTGNNAAFTCITSAHCTADSGCTGQSGKSVCDLDTTSKYYKTCEQCSSLETPASCGSEVCDTTSTDTAFDQCVSCSPADGTATSGNGCATKTPICTTGGTCVQCTVATEATDCSSNVLQACDGATGLCVCSSGAPGCPDTATCNTTTNRCSN